MTKADIALWVIRALRWVPKSYAYDRHLTDCAALAVIYYPWPDYCEDPSQWRPAENLMLSHVFKLRPLPAFCPPPRSAEIIPISTRLH